MTLKIKDIKAMSKQERERKIKELKTELIKSKVSSAKTGSSKTKEVRRVIARLLTYQKMPEENSGKGKPKK